MNFTVTICPTIFILDNTCWESQETQIQTAPYLEAVDLALRETSHPGSVPSSDRPIKITATNESVFPENQLVKKKAMALQA